MNSSRHHHHHHDHHDVHQQRLLWFFSFCNQRSSSSSSSSSGSNRRSNVSNRRKSNSNRNKFAIQYQQQLQQQKRQTSDVFGCDLTEHTRLFSANDSVPDIVKSCTRFIEKHGIIFGIYRLSGMRVNIQKLRQDFDKNPTISMIDNEAISNDAHAVACVLKQYFRELPTPLLTFHMYEKFIELFKQSNVNTNNSTSNNNNNSSTMSDDSDEDEIINNDQSLEIDRDKTHYVHQKGGPVISPTNESAIAQSQAILSSAIATKCNSSCTMQSKLSQSAIATRKKKFTTSASDSQLISLSSVVTTTASDVKYQVKLGELRKLLMQLPRAHYQTLKFLMSHLACIAANGKKTGMDSKNVAIVWAPNLLKPRELELSAGLETLQLIGLQAVITEQLIKHHKFLFGLDETDGGSRLDEEVEDENHNHQDCGQDNLLGTNDCDGGTKMSDVEPGEFCGDRLQNSRSEDGVEINAEENDASSSESTPDSANNHNEIPNEPPDNKSDVAKEPCDYQAQDGSGN